MSQYQVMPEAAETVEVVDIQFRPGQKIYFFDPAGAVYNAFFLDDYEEEDDIQPETKQGYCPLCDKDILY